MYHSHFNKICGLSEQAHLNTCFKHFMYFTQVRAGSVTAQLAAVPRPEAELVTLVVQAFDLIDPSELTPLRELIDNLMR